MTRAGQIHKTLELLNPSRSDRAACRADVENALDIMAGAIKSAQAWEGVRSKAAARAESVLHNVLSRLRYAYRRAAGGGGVPISLKTFDIEQALRDTDPQSYDEVVYRAGGKRQTFAVALAYELVTKWRPDVEPVTTRGKPWHRLAAILFGNARADLFRHLRAFRPDLSPFRRGHG